MRQRLVCFGGSLAEILKERLQFPADLVRVLQGFFQLGAVFFNHSARVGKRGGKVRAVLRAEQIIYTCDRLFHFGGPVVQIAKKFLSLRVQVVELRRQGVEVDVFE